AAVEFSLDGRRLLSSNKVPGPFSLTQSGGDLQLWDLEASREIPLDATHTQSACISPDSKRLIAISIKDPKAKDPAHEMRIFDLENGRRIATEPCNGYQVLFAPDNRTFLTLGFGAKKGVPIAWDMVTGKKRFTLDVDTMGNLPWNITSPGRMTRGSIF